MTEARGGYGQALAVLVLGGVVIGLSPIFVRLAEAGPAAAGFWRLAVALPFLALMTRRAEGKIAAPSRFGVIAGVMFALDLGFWHYGVKYTTVATATVLTNLTPVVVTIFAWAFLRQRPRPLFVLAVAIAVAGAWTMAFARQGGPAINAPLGNVLSLTTALWYALYMIAIGQGRLNEGASRLMFWSSAIGAPLLLAAALALGEPIFPAGPVGWGACIGLGLMHVVGQGAIAWAMGRLPTATASVVVLVQPVAAGALAWMLFAEAIGPLQGLGAAVTLTGVVLAQWAGRAPKA